MHLREVCEAFHKRIHRGEGCTDEYVCPAYRISLIATDTGRPLCDGEVQISPPEAGQCWMGSTSTAVNCKYWLSIPSGTTEASLTALHDGYETSSATVSTEYETDDCDHALEVPVAMWLYPSD